MNSIQLMNTGIRSDQGTRSGGSRPMGHQLGDGLALTDDAGRCPQEARATDDNLAPSRPGASNANPPLRSSIIASMVRQEYWRRNISLLRKEGERTSQQQSDALMPCIGTTSRDTRHGSGRPSSRTRPTLRFSGPLKFFTRNWCTMRSTRSALCWAAPAILGLLAATSPLPSRALTFNFSFPVTGGFPDNSSGQTVTGSISGLGLQDNTQNWIDQTQVIATVTQALNSGPQTFDSLLNGSSGYITISGGSITAYSFNFYGPGQDSLFNAELTPGISIASVSKNINGPIQNYKVDTYNYSVSGDPTLNIFGSSPAPVPGPLPILGASTAFAWSRRLRRRQRAGQASKSCSNLG